VADEFDNWPLQHEDAEVWAARRCTELLAYCEKAWLAGISPAVADAVAICRTYRQAPPAWLVEAVITVAKASLTPVETRRRRENMIHLTRWDAVRDLRDRRHQLLEQHGDNRGTSWERCFAAVSEYLEDTEAAGSESTIRASYDIVQRAIRAGRGGEFLLVNRRIDETSDLLAFTRKPWSPRRRRGARAPKRDASGLG
jgi:hypothetical protein